MRIYILPLVSFLPSFYFSILTRQELPLFILPARPPPSLMFLLNSSKAMPRLPPRLSLSALFCPSPLSPPSSPFADKVSSSFSVMLFLFFMKRKFCIGYRFLLVILLKYVLADAGIGNPLHHSLFDTFLPKRIKLVFHPLSLPFGLFNFLYVFFIFYF